MSIELTLMSLDFESSGKPVTKVFQKDELTLGRLPSNDVVLNKPEVSGIHARIRVEQGRLGEPARLFITDLGSSNGTMVENNSLRAKVEVAMLPNERIIIGNYLIKPRFFGGKDSEIDLDQEEGLEEEADLSSDDNLGETLEQLQAETNALLAQHKSPNRGNGKIGTVSDISGDDTLLGIPKVSTGEIELAQTELKAESTQDVVVPRDANFVPKAENEKRGLSELAEDAFEVFIDGSDQREINFEAKALFPITGKIVRNEQGVPGVVVDGGPLGKAITGEDGSFEFADIVEGTAFTLRFSKDKSSIHPAEYTAVLEQGTQVPLITLKRLCSISGVISHRGTPLSGVEVHASGIGVTTTGSDGRYTFENVIEGSKYSIRVDKPGFVFASQS